MARTIRRAHSSALMISLSRIGDTSTVRPSGPGERFRISDCTKYGAITVTETPVARSSIRSESKKPICACLVAA